ncbi:MAG TPA: hypothetical protein VFV32_13630 [Acidimicrobiales bacterium]|nr:hypothetical protein [Acidimicrobiales bacterium]
MPPWSGGPLRTAPSRARRTALLGLCLLLVGLFSSAMAASARAEDCPPVTLLNATCTPVSSSTTADATTTSTTARPATTTTAARPTTTTTRPKAAATTTTTTAPTTTSTVTVTTVSNLLVPGDGTEGAESTTTTTVEPASATSDGGLSDGTLIGIVVVGLVLIAIAVAVLTWRYWVATRPVPVEAPRRRPAAG